MNDRPKYFFAHNVMKCVAFNGDDRLGGIIIFNQERFISMLRKAWIYASYYYNKEVEAYDPRIYTMTTDDNKLIAMFSSPEPKELLDTYYCAFVFGEDKIRYFTVELGKGRDLLCEWNKSGHVNYGVIENDISVIMNKISEIYNKVDTDDIFKIISEHEADSAWRMVREKYTDCLAVCDRRGDGNVFL